MRIRYREHYVHIYLLKILCKLTIYNTIFPNTLRTSQINVNIINWFLYRFENDFQLKKSNSMDKLISN